MQTEVVAMIFFLAAWLLQAPTPALENDYVRVTRDASPCASANAPGCGERVIVALGEIELRFGKSRRKMTRGDIAVFKPGESYNQPTGGPFFEVNIKPNRPPVQSPPEIIPPEKNAIRYDGERFVTKNMWHACGKYTLEALFARSEPHVFHLFNKFAEMMRACGPVTMIPQKTRVVFQVRVRFGGCYPRKSHLLCTLALPRVDDDPRFFKIEKFTSHFIGHSFRVYSEADLDADVRRWMREAYEVGEQKHLKGTSKAKRVPVARASKESKDTRPSSLSKRGQT